jgi:hypothetical protein
MARGNADATAGDVWGAIPGPDVTTASVETMHAQVSNFDPDVGGVLFQSGAEKLYREIESLSDSIGELGGRTECTEGHGETRAASKREAGHVGT